MRLSFLMLIWLKYRFLYSPTTSLDLSEKNPKNMQYIPISLLKKKKKKTKDTNDIFIE